MRINFILLKAIENAVNFRFGRQLCIPTVYVSLDTIGLSSQYVLLCTFMGCESDYYCKILDFSNLGHF